MANPVTPNFETIAQPGAIVRQLEGRPWAELVALFHRAESATARGWMLMAIIVGVALSKAKYGQGAAKKLANDLGCSERTVHRLAEFFSELINPRLEVEGDRAKFPLEQQRFYALAIEGADVTERKPLELLAEAEAAWAKDPKFTPRAFKRRIYGERETRRSSRLLPAVKQLANARADAVRQLVTVADATELTEILDAAVAKLTDARRFLQREAA